MGPVCILSVVVSICMVVYDRPGVVARCIPSCNLRISSIDERDGKLSDGRSRLLSNFKVIREGGGRRKDHGVFRVIRTIIKGYKYIMG